MTLKRGVNPHPLRLVVAHEVGPSGPDHAAPWLLTLECGHRVVRYRRIRPGSANPPVPKRAHCSACTYGPSVQPRGGNLQRPRGEQR